MVQFSKMVSGQLYRALKRSFPDAHVGNDDILALAICLQFQKERDAEEIPQELSAIDLTPYHEQLRTRAAELSLEDETYECKKESGDSYRYYWAEARHVRSSPEGFAPFVGKLGMVRVTLDADTPRTYKTAFGRVSPGDHLIDTVFEANQKYSRGLGYSLQRVDLITPAREGLRFGAISVFLGYRDASDKSPSCYILEAGTATGQPKVLYLGKEIGKSINAYSGYEPTPFACASHAYLGTFTLKPGTDEPDQLAISARSTEGGKSHVPYIDVTIRWTEQLGSVHNIWPGFLIARATSIVLWRASQNKISTQCSDSLPGGAA